MINAQEHVKNRNAFPPEELAKYYGKHVAWSLDGKRILAAADDPLELVASLKAAGIPSDDYVLSFVDSGAELNGALFTEGVWERTE